MPETIKYAGSWLKINLFFIAQLPNHICDELHASSKRSLQINSRSVSSGSHPNRECAILASATSTGGSPGRRSVSLISNNLPVTFWTALMIFMTEWPWPVPRLKRTLLLDFKRKSKARIWAVARSLSEFDHPVLFIRIHINTYSPLLINNSRFCTERSW